jgi:hypothetical protein
MQFGLESGAAQFNPVLVTLRVAWRRKPLILLGRVLWDRLQGL